MRSFDQHTPHWSARIDDLGLGPLRLTDDMRGVVVQVGCDRPRLYNEMLRYLPSYYVVVIASYNTATTYYCSIKHTCISFVISPEISTLVV